MGFDIFISFFRFSINIISFYSEIIYLLVFFLELSL